MSLEYQQGQPLRAIEVLEIFRRHVDEEVPQLGVVVERCGSC